MSCSHKRTCPLYPKLSDMKDFWVKMYCDGKFERCVRYTNSAKGLPVSLNLLPNGKSLV